MGSLGQRVHRAPPAPEQGEEARGARASFVLRRMRWARLLPASLLLAILTATMVTVALAGFGARALPAAEHRRLANVADATIEISGQVGTARADADAKVIRTSIAAALGHTGFGMLNGRWSDQLTLPKSGAQAQAPTLQAAALDGVTGHAELTAGHWPAARSPGRPIQVALPASTAAMLHLAVGQALTLPDSITGTKARLLVTGLFRPKDPAAPYWRLSLLGTSGKLAQGAFVTYGPMLVAPTSLGPGALTPGQASWLLTVDTARIAPSETGPLGARLGTVMTSLQTRQDLGSLQAATSLPQTLSALGSSLVVARSLLLIGSLQLILLAIAAAALAARLLATQREEENALLSARGVARGQLALASLAEAALLTVAGVAAGTVLGSYFAALLMSASGLPHGSGGGLAGTLRQGLAGGAWWPAAVIAVLVIVVVVRPALRPVSPGTARLRRGRQAALATAARAGLDTALLVLGVLAFLELRRYSAVPRLSGGGLGIDPVLAVAPVLALAGLALLPLRALPAAARLLDRFSAHGKHLVSALASWQVSRRPVRQGGPILLVVLAVGTGTLVLAQHQSWRQSQLDQAAFATGADARVSLAGPLPLARAGLFAHSPGVLGAMPVSNFNSGFDVYALNARAAAATVLLRTDLATPPPPALWQRIIPARAGPGLALPGRPARIAVTASVRPPHGIRLGRPQVSLSIQDGWGIVYQVPAGGLPADGHPHQVVAGLTGRAASGAGQARYPLRLLGISLSYRLPPFPVAALGSAAVKQVEAKVAANRATLVVHGVAVSPRGSGGFPAPLTAAGRAGVLPRWHAAAGSAQLADPHASGVEPAVKAWLPGPAALTFSVGTGLLVQRAGVPPLPVTGQLSLTAGYPTGPLPAIASRAFLATANAHLGAVVLVPVGNTTVPMRLVATTHGFPSAGSSAPVVIVDQPSLQGLLAAQSQPPVPVGQWWLRTAHGAAPRPPAGASVITADRAAAALLGDPLPNVPQLALLVIAVAAALLAAIGFVVCVVAAVTERRLQDALLAALGVGRGARTGQLCLEQLMLSVPAAAAGALIGAGLARLLVPAVTLTGGAAAPFPPVRVVLPLGWTALLALAVAAVPVIAAAAAAAYHPDPAAQLRAGESM